MNNYNTTSLQSKQHVNFSSQLPQIIKSNLAAFDVLKKYEEVTEPSQLNSHSVTFVKAVDQKLVRHLKV